MKYYDPLVYIVPAEEDGFTLKTILRNRLHISRSLLARLKQTEQGIMVNGERKYVNVKVHAGDRIEVRMEQETSDDIMPQDIPFQIIHEDEYILVVNKEAGMIVHPTLGHYVNTLANAVIHYWQQQGISYRFRPVHRLDQDTSGVLVIAKNPYVHHLISEQLKRQEVLKEYIALVHGVISQDEGTIDGPMDRDPERPHLRIVTETGYRAVTHYRVEERYPHATLVRIELETGRTHQIRVHMKHIGHPLIGDPLYGIHEQVDFAEPSLPMIGRHALHAAKLGFTHPMDKTYVEYTAPLPDDMEQCIEQLRKQGFP